MGVPAFFRWLSRKYPSIVVHCVEEKPKILGGVKIPVDASQPNPNNYEFDNLYLDMNGIIHPCCHPENKPAPKNEDEMMVAIFEYIDRIFSIVRPRRLLYMAIDGVAPRAKMNQQRSRRFRASKESVEKASEIAHFREELSSKGVELPPEKPKEEHFDSNCITPGTPFMDRLAKCLHYYIHDRLNNDPGWRNIEVILSDANVPGEGEHKIMDYIRRQRSNPDHDPNTRHCLCGADADLIMLGLATHEPNFTIIREEFKPNQPRPCELCGQLGHEMKECTGAAKVAQGENDELEKPIETDVEFIFIRLNVLREYLAKELDMPNLPFPFDLERAIDDWVFMCFFVGNDFLPHLPSLEIREGAIDRLVELYKRAVYRTGGYLTDSGHVGLQRVQLIMTELGEVEDEIFKKRQQNELSFRERQKERKKRMKMMNDKPAWTPGGQFSPQAISSTPSPVQNARQEAYQMRMMSATTASGSPNQSKKSDDSGSNNHSRASTGEKRKREDDDSEEEPVDDVRLWEDGWKDRYYEIKFEVSKDNYSFRHKVAAAYVEGLCWVLRYYYQGCASWKWYFPYHYAPFASDFINIGDLGIEFEKGTEPFKPLEQLMGVFPAASRQHVPEPWAKLMTDPESPIIDFYPTDFKVDLNGKKYAWQGVALLPFVDEKRLLSALKSVYPMLTPAERQRNIRGKDRLYIRKGHSGYDYLLGLYENQLNKTLEIEINPQLFSGMRGKVVLSDDVIEPDQVIDSPVLSLPSLPGNAAICISFIDPTYPDNFIFPAVRLKDAIEPPKVLKPGEMPITNNRQWRPQAGMSPARNRAFVSDAGHRSLNFSMNRSTYNEIPPPSYMAGGYSNVPRNVPGGYSGRGASGSYQRNSQGFSVSASFSQKTPDYSYSQSVSYSRSGNNYNNDRDKERNQGRSGISRWDKPRSGDNYSNERDQGRSGVSRWDKPRSGDNYSNERNQGQPDLPVWGQKSGDNYSKGRDQDRPSVPQWGSRSGNNYNKESDQRQPGLSQWGSRSGNNYNKESDQRQTGLSEWGSRSGDNYNKETDQRQPGSSGWGSRSGDNYNKKSDQRQPGLSEWGSRSGDNYYKERDQGQSGLSEWGPIHTNFSSSSASGYSGYSQSSNLPTGSVNSYGSAYPSNRDPRSNDYSRTSNQHSSNDNRQPQYNQKSQQSQPPQSGYSSYSSYGRY